MDPTPKLGGMYKFMEAHKQDDYKEDQILMATKKSKKFVKLTGKKDQYDISQSARKLNFNESNPNMQKTVPKNENSNSFDFLDV